MHARTQGCIEIINAYNRKNVAGHDYNASYTQRDEVLQLPLLLSFGINCAF